MQRILFLQSSGRERHNYRVLLPYLHKTPRDVRICYITTAADPEPNKHYLQYTRDALHSWGFSSIHNYDLKGKNMFSLRQELKDFDMYFMCGGNTFYLLRYIRESGFDKVFPSLLSHGKIYVGESAGSYVACPTIAQATWKNADTNTVGLTDFTGLNFVPFLLTAHYTPEQHQLLTEAAAKTDLPIVALTDRQAILGVGHKYKIVGEGEKVTFNNFAENF